MEDSAAGLPDGAALSCVVEGGEVVGGDEAIAAEAVVGGECPGEVRGGQAEEVRGENRDAVGAGAGAEDRFADGVELREAAGDGDRGEVGCVE